MRILTITPTLHIVCEWGKTRHGFKHTATLTGNGMEEKVKVCYYNRTWEAHTYDTVISKLVEKSKILTEEQKLTIKKLL